jgi:catechol 2,3-dioxygenase
MEVKELGHLVLYVRNLERSARFYRDVLGWRQLAPNDELGFPAAAFSAPSNRTHHELLLIEVGEDAQPLPRGRHVGLYHFVTHCDACGKPAPRSWARATTR